MCGTEAVVVVQSWGRPSFDPTGGLSMKVFEIFLTAGIAAALLFALGGCAPEVGSEKWCANLQAKPKGDWSANEAVDYAKHCILK
jgi:hypothetical protein